MPLYFEFVGSKAEAPLIRLVESKVPRVVLDGGKTAYSFPADTEADIWRSFSAKSGRFNIGPGPMNVRVILRWDDEGDHMVHVWVFPRYAWST